MSFECNQCQKTFRAESELPDWLICCPRCGGPATFAGSSEASSPKQAPITLTRVGPPRRRTGGERPRTVPLWAIGGAVAAFLLLAVLGVVWALGPGSRPKATDLALGAAPTQQQQPAPLAVARSEEPLRIEVVRAPSEEKPPAKVPPEEEKPLAVVPIAEVRPAKEEKLPTFVSKMPVVEVPQAGPQPAPKLPPPQPVEGPAVPKVEARPQPLVPPSATFMGVKSRGKRICIIADCSGSMAFNNRMVRLQKEMARTLKALSPEQEFYVIFFSSTAMPMPANSWRRGGKDVKRILPWIGLQPANGSTEPLPAFEIAFKLRPRPDVIYFLTDGIIPKHVPDLVARMNGAGANKVPINAILFGGELPGMEARMQMVPVARGGRIVMVPRPVAVPKMEKDDGQLERIARDSGGTYRFVPDGTR